MAGFVYVIGASEAGPVKVGRANNPKTRLADLQVAHPVRLLLLHSVECEDPHSVEAKAHVALAEHRLLGEWFNLTSAAASEAVDRAFLTEVAEVEAAFAERQKAKDERFMQAMALHAERENVFPSQVELLSDAALKMADVVGVQRLRERTERLVRDWQTTAAQRSFFLWAGSNREIPSPARVLTWQACGLMLSCASRYWRRRKRAALPRPAPLLDYA